MQFRLFDSELYQVFKKYGKEKLHFLKSFKTGDETEILRNIK